MSMNTFFKQLQNGPMPSLEDSMRYEGLRLATFHKRPRNYTTSASRLAHAGFYYNAEDDLVECFKCNIRVKDWDISHAHVDPFILHCDRSPRCAFLNNDKENVPYSVDAKFCNLIRPTKPGFHSNALSGSQEHIRPLFLKETVQPASTFQEPLQENKPRKIYLQSSTDIDNSEFSANDNKPSAIHNVIRSNALNSQYNATTQTTGSLFDSPPPPPPRFVNDIQGMPNFMDEKARMETFNYWPNGVAMRPAELAKAGFYYLGTEDRVQCAFCKGVLRNWDPTDRALEEHKKHFPACPFIRDPKSSGNIPALDHLSGVRLRREVPTEQELEDYMIGIMTERAYHPHMALTVERVNSFGINFYSESSRTPEEFAEAGFFFTGQGDNVKCFFCDGGLRNWERNDDPWLEHARWFPKCGYLRTKKGDEYVNEIRIRYAPPGTQKPRVRKLKARHKVNPRRLEQCMSSEMVQNVLDMGYPMSQVKQTVERRFAELGAPFPNVESLIESIYETEELEKQGPESDTESDKSDDTTASSSFNITSGSSEDIKFDASCEPNKQESSKDVNGATAKQKKQKSKKKKRKNKTNESAAQINPIELMSDEKGSELAAEIQKMKDERVCKVCMDSEVNIVFLKCGHMVCCSDCAPAMRCCPICRQTIRGTIRVFLS